MNLPENWSEQEWTAFVLLDAAHADGRVLNVELRSLGVAVGSDRIQEAKALYAEMTADQRADLIKLGIKVFLTTDESKDRLLKRLKQLFLADGEYATEEQDWMRKISGWIRGE